MFHLQGKISCTIVSLPYLEKLVPATSNPEPTHRGREAGPQGLRCHTARALAQQQHAVMIPPV